MAVIAWFIWIVHQMYKISVVVGVVLISCAASRLFSLAESTVLERQRQFMVGKMCVCLCP